MNKQQNKDTSSIVTTKILAVGSLTEKGLSQIGRVPVMKEEVPATVDLYLEGKIDSWYSKTDNTGVVFLMNVDTVEEAHALLQALPLGAAGMMEFQLTALGPLIPLHMLVKHA